MKIIVMAPRGKMGKLIVKTANARPDMEIVAAVAPAGRNYIGNDVGEVAGIGSVIGAPVVGNLTEVIDLCDVIIDYTTIDTSLTTLQTARKHNKAVVCGTTGFTPEHWELLKEASHEIPLLYGANTSRVVNMLYDILTEIAAKLGDEADIEIIEMHDRNKKDAPSGTSIELGRAIAAGLGKPWENVAVFGRQGHSPRGPGSIGYHSVRAGDISSSHTIMFGLNGERLEITHHAHNWECFAAGACTAAAFLIGKPPGFYTVKDVLTGK